MFSGLDSLGGLQQASESLEPAGTTWKPLLLQVERGVVASVSDTCWSGTVLVSGCALL